MVIGKLVEFISGLVPIEDAIIQNDLCSYQANFMFTSLLQIVIIVSFVSLQHAHHSQISCYVLKD